MPIDFSTVKPGAKLRIISAARSDLTISLTVCAIEPGEVYRDGTATYNVLTMKTVILNENGTHTEMHRITRDGVVLSLESFRVESVVQTDDEQGLYDVALDLLRKEKKQREENFKAGTAALLKQWDADGNLASERYAGRCKNIMLYGSLEPPEPCP